MTETMDVDASITDAPFTLTLLSEPLLSYTKEALTASPETAANKYNVLEAQLRGHLLSILAQPNPLDQLQVEWTACWDICVYILQENDALSGFIRKLPFVLLEDVVECLSSEKLETFYTTLDTTRTPLSTGPLWQLPALNTSHVLQYIRLQNAILQKLPKHAGTILMEMSNALSLSDRSALKPWGSVSGRTLDEYEDMDEEDEEKEEEQQQQQHGQERSSFAETFWSVQHDMQNPYKIQFAHFVTGCKQILAALESNHTTTKTTLSNNNKNNSSHAKKYLTKRSLLALQLQDGSFCQCWLTQFLILTSFFSWQSSQLKNTLHDLSNRAKTLLQKLPNGADYLATLEETLHHSEVHWRQWKQQKCKPDMELKQKEEEEEDDSTITTATTTLVPPSHLTKSRLTLQDLQETGKQMAVPSVESHLQEYVEALDPESGIEDAYHPKHNALYAWKSLRLLGTHHLNYFGEISRHNGDFEPMVRCIYKDEFSIDIPGQGPEKQVELDYDENTTCPASTGPTEDAVKHKVEDQDVKKEDGEDKAMEDTTEHQEEVQDEPMKDANDGGDDEEGIEPTPAESESESELEQKEEANANLSDGEDESPASQETEAKQEVTEPIKNEESKPTKPLTAFEQAALEEEEILLAEHDETNEEKKPPVVKSEAKDTKPKGGTATKDTKPVASSRNVTTTSVDDRKRKRGTSDGTASTADTSKRTRTATHQQGRNTSDPSQVSQRRQDKRGPTVLSFRDMDRPHSQQPQGRGGGAGGRGQQQQQQQQQQPPRRSPVPGTGTGATRQPPVPGVGGRGGRDGSGRGRSGGRGGGGGRGPPQRRDNRRRY